VQARHESRDHHQKTTLLPAFPLLVAQYEQMVEQAEYASLQCNVNPLAAPIVIKLVMVAQATIAVKLPSTATKTPFIGNHVAQAKQQCQRSCQRSYQQNE
jgi:hypothetical protein